MKKNDFPSSPNKQFDPFRECFFNKPVKAIEDFAKAGPVNDEVLLIISDEGNLSVLPWEWKMEYLLYKQCGGKGWVTLWDYDQIKDLDKFKEDILKEEYDHVILYDVRNQKLALEIKG